jgi:hypothetical protein
LTVRTTDSARAGARATWRLGVKRPTGGSHASPPSHDFFLARVLLS